MACRWLRKHDGTLGSQPNPTVVASLVARFLAPWWHVGRLAACGLALVVMSMTVLAQLLAFVFVLARRARSRQGDVPSECAHDVHACMPWCVGPGVGLPH